MKGVTIVREIYRRDFYPTDPRLKRRVHHDSESRRYVFDTSGLTLTSFDWSKERTLPILDQGQVGACTADAGTGLLSYTPWYKPVAPAFVKAFGSFDQSGAYRLYSAEETADGDGPYPPQDNGSSGLTLAKTLRAAAVITGFTQTFTLEDALTAGQVQPFVAGTNWFESMFTSDGEGIVKIDFNSGLAGGHEYVVSSYDSARGLIGCDNSWGASWGKAGRFFVDVEDWGKLLGQQGDTTFFTLPSQPAPTPTPSPDPGQAMVALAAAVRHNDWYQHHHVGDNARVANAAMAAIRAGEL